MPLSPRQVKPSPAEEKPSPAEEKPSPQIEGAPVLADLEVGRYATVQALIDRVESADEVKFYDNCLTVIWRSADRLFGHSFVILNVFDTRTIVAVSTQFGKGYYREDVVQKFELPTRSIPRIEELRSKYGAHGASVTLDTILKVTDPGRCAFGK